MLFLRAGIPSRQAANAREATPMSHSDVCQTPRPAGRPRGFRERIRDWKRRARRAATLALVVAGVASIPLSAEGQMGQTAMAPAGGILGNAATSFAGLAENGPGWLYYGLNAADRGLGYNGSYMTLGGFIPYGEDDLGGLWAADLRSHLSVYGGFFSNVGAVRKQFIGGTLLGVGVYWDYDGDLNQYPLNGMQGAEFGQFGHVYNQIGISGEWLTDYGNLRSNGYIPLGTTAYTAGAPNSPYFENFLMCQYGLDSALGGTDLEVGAYIPGLADWAGMVSVGGYAYGNSRYDWSVGPQAGQAIVPWFGGVYTRLDMTFLNNWDFSLQANNDSYFDWTGFARLTYRMGGSRRRNVPDQMEQPMMRNEHIVRAHQTPIIALNPENGNQPWRVVHVNNTATPVGDGTAAAPFTTIVTGNAAATQPWDIVVVANGGLAYDGTFSPLASNQYFIGQGSPFYVPTANCGPINVGGVGNIRPTLTNPTGSSINLANGLVANNFEILNSATAISGSGNLTGLGRPSLAQRINISSTNPSGSHQGIVITNATGDAQFRVVNVANMTDGAFVVDGGDPNLDFANGSIVNAQDHLLRVTGTIGGQVALTADPGRPFTDTGDGVLIENSGGDVVVQNKTPGLTSLAISSQRDGIRVSGSSGNQTFDGAKIDAAGGTGFAGVQLRNNAGTTNLNNLEINLADPNASPGLVAVNANVVNVTGTSNVTVDNAAAVSMTNVTDVAASFGTVSSNGSTTNGLVLVNVAGSFDVTSNLAITDAADDGVVIRNSPNLNFSSPQTTVNSVAGDGIVLVNNDPLNAASVALGQMTVTTAAGAGLVVSNASASNLGGSIVATGGASIAANNADLDLTLASASSTNSAGAGLTMSQASGQSVVSRTIVATPVSNGIDAVENQPGFSADFGTTSITGIANGAVGVNLANSATPLPETSYSFDSLQITTTNGTGLRTRNAGVVNINSPAAITATGGAAIDLENTTGTSGDVAGSGFAFLSLVSTDSSANGVRLSNLNSNLRVIGTTTITNAAAASLSIIDTDGIPQTNSISFAQVNVVDRNSVGMVVDGVYGQVQVASLNIDNGQGVAGDAVLIQDTTNPADPQGTGSGRVYIGGGTIADSAGNGIRVRNGLAAITGVSVTEALGQGILATAGAGETTTVSIGSSTIVSAVGVTGLRLEATGSGVTNGTFFSTFVNVPGDSLATVVYDASSKASVNATGNFGATAGAPGAGGFTLSNAGGLLSINQGSTLALTSANNGVAVTVPGTPVTFNGSTPPVPPPTP
jgi:hypothetical protein